MKLTIEQNKAFDELAVMFSSDAWMRFVATMQENKLALASGVFGVKSSDEFHFARGRNFQLDCVLAFQVGVETEKQLIETAPDDEQEDEQEEDEDEEDSE